MTIHTRTIHPTLTTTAMPLAAAHYLAHIRSRHQDKDQNAQDDKQGVPTYPYYADIADPYGNL